MLLNKKQYCTFLCTVCTVSSSDLGSRAGSEVEKVDKVLRGEGHGATFWVVGCAGMVCVLGRETKSTIDINFLLFSLLKCSFSN